MRKHIERINKSIEYLFYALFLTSPLAMHPYTSELFEMNKMWLVWIFSLVIFFLWGSKVIILKRFEVRRTFFDIPILLFLASQIISTFLSLDPHTSFWGYYSRWNGGLLSTISYIFLFYAFTTNVLSDDHETTVRKIYNTLIAVFISAVIVALWGVPSHFGYDPTCLVFRQSFDVSCWTEAFRPEIRMFSTLGQPNWLATFLAIILPITVAFILIFTKKIKKSNLSSLNTAAVAGLTIAAIIFYLDLGWTLSQSGFIAFWGGSFVFFVLYTLLLIKKTKIKYETKAEDIALGNSGTFSFSQEVRYFLLGIINIYKNRLFLTIILLNVLFILITFFTVNPIPRLQGFNVSNVFKNQPESTEKKTTETESTTPASAQPALEASITGSGEIRQIVWKGAIDIFKANPIFGTGVETFAFAYYKHRPVEHNLTSEWDYLYNKAHNEHLNYLATTGIVGLGTYLLFIFSFLFYALKILYFQFKRKVIGNPILPALVGSFIAIQISNFFGFSVVNVNLLMFFIPIFFYFLVEKDAKFLLLLRSAKDTIPSEISTGQIMAMVIIAIFSIFNIIMLINFWSADKNYALGSNYQRINEFALANPELQKAVDKRPGEDLFKNELSVNLAAIALSFAEQGDQQNTNIFATRAKELSDGVAKRNPNNVVYWKTRTRVMFSLAQLNPAFITQSIQAIETAHKLAPTDAKITYNKALIYDQAGQFDNGIEAINETIKIKPNYRDAYYAKALFYSQFIEKNPKSEKVTEYRMNAVDSLNFTLQHINPEDSQAKDLLRTLE